MEKDNLSNTPSAIDTILTSFHIIQKQQFKMDQGKKVKAKSVEFLGENTVANLPDTGFGNDSLNITPEAQTIKEKKMDELDFMEITKFMHQRILSTE